MTRSSCRPAAAVAVGAAVIGACVIAEPPTDLPTIVEQPPTVARAGVVPSPTVVLTRWPETFIVPVRLTDPKTTLVYSYFIDYNAATGDGYIQTIESRFEIGSTPGGQRLLEIPIPEPPPPDRCHTIEVVVALNLNTSDGRNAHTPLPPGGDSVSWFYSPGGDLAGCPGLAANINPDAQALQLIRDGGS